MPEDQDVEHPWPARRELLRAATVMVLDDQEANLAWIEQLLTHAGVGQVLSLSDPFDALARCVQDPPDLLVLDMHMPELDGFKVMDQLRRELSDDHFLPILVLTADVTIETRDRALEAGAIDFLSKPFDRNEIALRVANLVEVGSLHRRIATDNGRLRVELEAQRAEERRIASEIRARTERIEHLLDSEDLAIAFQPVVDLRAGTIVGTEALARFPSGDRPPNLWFDDAHAVGMGAELEVLAIETALRQLDSLPLDTFVAINLSPSVVDSGLLHQVLERIDGRRVVIELTEHSRIEDYESLIDQLDSFRLQGIRVAVDDAGAGYAGLRHILRLRPDLLKMDIELIRGIDDDPARRALATALMLFAEEIGAVVVAEGIETREELETLQALGVRFGQGYHLARPGPLPLASAAIAAVVRESGADAGAD
jgi:EAL domain-containing protein (putative c-di-GMP-specific phosphodiesterase class I)/AmiR/NasT family two-component response regulator